MGFFSGFAGAIGGALLGGSLQRSSAAKAYDREKEFYQQRHQWEVEDLKKAGLNPILSAGKGMTGGIPSVQKADVPDFGSVTAKGMEMAIGKQTIKESKAKEEATSASGRVASAEAKIKEIEAQIKQWEFDLLRRTTGSKTATGLVESLPKWMRGIARTMIGLPGAEATTAKQSRVEEKKTQEYIAPQLDKLKTSGKKTTLLDLLKSGRVQPIGTYHGKKQRYGIGLSNKKKYYRKRKDKSLKPRNRYERYRQRPDQRDFYGQSRFFK